MTKINDIKHPFYKDATRRIRNKHQNVLILIVGDPGTGKSLVALKIAQRLDPTFTMENIRERVVVEPEQFSQLIAEDGDSKLEPGAAVIIDEAGAAALGARDWYSIGNKMISRILQTFRYRQIILIMTVPNMSFIDIHGRKLINYLIETNKVDFENLRTEARVWKINFNKISGDSEPYRERFRIKDEFGETVILDRMWFNRVDIKLVHAYEKYADEFKRGITQKALRDIQRVGDKNNKKEFDPKEIAEKILSNRDRYYKPNAKIDKGMIEIDFGIGENRSRQVVAAVRQLLLSYTAGKEAPNSSYNKIDGKILTDNT
jgi:nicotinamide riboside kinase